MALPSRGAHVAVAVVFAFAAAAHDARAQSAQDAAAAQVLFEQAKQLMRDKKYAEACPKLVESNRLDVGIGSSLWLADCFEKNGQSASAWAEFTEAADMAGKKHDDREKVARERAANLERSLVKLKIDVSPANDVRNLEITRDGVVVRKALWGVEVPVDPGAHTFEVSAPGKKTWQITLEVAAGSGRRVVAVPALEDDREPTLEVATIAAQRAPDAPAAPEASASSDAPAGLFATPQRATSVVAVGVGVIGLGLGTLFGLQAKSHLDESNADGHCHADNRCDPIGTAARNDAISAATLSTVGFVAGAALIAGGVVFYIIAPTPSARGSARSRPSSPISRLQIEPMFGASERGLVLRADF